MFVEQPKARVVCLSVSVFKTVPGFGTIVGIEIYYVLCPQVVRTPHVIPDRVGFRFAIVVVSRHNCLRLEASYGMYQVIVPYPSSLWSFVPLTAMIVRRVECAVLIDIPLLSALHRGG